MRLRTLLAICFLFSAPVVSAQQPAASADIFEQTLQVGKPAVYESRSPQRPFSVLFEDDGQVAYFYGLSTDGGGNPILDTLHIYDVPNVRDEHKVSTLRILWSRDGYKSLLLINDFAFAAFDFKAKRAWNRSGFPPPNRQWTEHPHDWDDKVIELFK